MFRWLPQAFQFRRNRYAISVVRLIVVTVVIGLATSLMTDESRACVPAEKSIAAAVADQVTPKNVRLLTVSVSKWGAGISGDKISGAPFCGGTSQHSTGTSCSQTCCSACSAMNLTGGSVCILDDVLDAYLLRHQGGLADNESNADFRPPRIFA